ncbi:hypothetical protein Peur_014793 [Populus x canadensis]
MRIVLDGGPWHVVNKLLVLKKWEPCMSLSQEELKKILVFGHATSKCLKKLSAVLMGGEEMMRRVKNNNGKSYQGREMERSYEK